jgi:hypothetical protein
MLANAGQIVQCRICDVRLDQRGPHKTSSTELTEPPAAESLVASQRQQCAQPPFPPQHDGSGEAQQCHNQLLEGCHLQHSAARLEQCMKISQNLQDVTLA